MSIKEQILQVTVSDPQYQDSIQLIKQQLSSTNIMAEDLAEAIKMLEFVVQNPDSYAEVRQAAIQDGLIDENMFPPQYDEVLIISLLAVLYAMEEELNQKGYAAGGSVGFGGQGGDTMLAHINPREAEVLRRMGGQGTVNPNTGLREYKGLRDALKIALPIALTFVAGPLGSVIGGSIATGIGLSAATAAIAAPIIGGAVVGAGSAALQGLISGEGLNARNIGIGALTGGVGGASGPLGNVISSATGINPEFARIAAGALTGVGQAAVRGDDLSSGAAQGALSQAFRNPIQRTTTRASNAVLNGFNNMFGPASVPGGDGLSFSNDTNNMTEFSNDEAFDQNQSSFELGSNLQAGIEADNNIQASQASLTPEYDPKFDALDPLIISSNMPPSDAPNLMTPERLAGYNSLQANSPQFLNSVGPPQGGPLSNIGVAELAGAALLASVLGESGAGDVKAKISSMDDETKAYFNQNLDVWDWRIINSEANKRGMTTNDFITDAQFMSRAQNGDFNTRSQNQGAITRAQGGISNFVSGAGSGRDDVINAMLSDGEFVVDAETVAMLGDGSNKEGARRLNKMRENLRSHKGKTLAKGKFSPDAKAPLQYMNRSA